MRFTLLATLLAALIPAAAVQAASIDATVDVSMGGTPAAPSVIVLGGPFDVAPGDTVNFTFRVASSSDIGVAAYLFHFVGQGGVTLPGSITLPQGGDWSKTVAGDEFSFVQTLGTDLPASPTPVAQFAIAIALDATPASGLTLAGDSNIVTSAFLEPTFGPKSLLNVVPEPGTALLLGLGAIGLAIVRRRA